MKITSEHKVLIKKCISNIPKDYDETHYELMIYEFQNNTEISDLEEFADFDGTIVNLKKVVNNIIKERKKTLSHIDFKYADREGDFDQFTIYQHKNKHNEN